MIHWMSKEVDELLDNYTDDYGTHIPMSFIVCEGGDKGWIELACEIGGDDVEDNLILGDCAGLTDAEINRRFVEEFAKFAKDHGRELGDYYLGGDEYLDGLAKALAATLG